ncbi:MAG: galactokinase [Candidatus Dormibacteria bacterium]
MAAAQARHAGVAGARAAWAPGRCTLVGDHVDYAGGRVLACTLPRGVAASVAPSPDGRWHVRSGGVDAVSDTPVGEGIALLPLAAVTALRRHEGIVTPPLDIVIAASLPFAAGLSSSASITCAVLSALLEGESRRLPPRRLADLAWVAEHDIAAVPCGRLDQRAVVESPFSGICVVDLGTDRTEGLRWPWPDVVLVVAGSGERHDVGAPEYAALREAAEAVLRFAGEETMAGLSRLRVAELPVELRRRGEHLLAEADHVRRAEAALRSGDRLALGRALGASHRDQRRLLGNSTARIDAMVSAAAAVPGCHGARMVGAGFGGSVVALCDAGAAAALRTALGDDAHVAVPSPGLAALGEAPPPATTLRQP